MAKPMNDEERAQALKDYNPKDHLIPVGKDRQGKVTLYYPAAWRLYELHLRYPNANFRSEILYQDEKGAVIVKAYLYLGKNYEESDKKAEAMKQGNMTTLDKVETAAKARCARDFGIGTEYALDMEPDETDATHDTPSPSTPTSPGKSKAIPAVPVSTTISPPEPEQLATSEQITQISALCEVTGIYEWKHLLSLAKLPESVEKWTEKQATAFITSTEGWPDSPMQKEWLSKPANEKQKEEISTFRRPEHYGSAAVAALKSRIPALSAVSSADFTREQADLLLSYLHAARETITRAKQLDKQFTMAKALGVSHPLDFYAAGEAQEQGLTTYLTKLNLLSPPKKQEQQTSVAA